MTRAEVQNLVVKVARRLSMPPALALALVEQESGFNPRAYRAEPTFYARNVAKNPGRYGAAPHFGKPERWGSYGLTQVLSSTAIGQGYPVELDPAVGGRANDGKVWPSLYDPEFSLELGLSYLSGHINRYSRQYRNFYRAALARYNAGSPTSEAGGRYATQVLRRAGRYLTRGVV